MRGDAAFFGLSGFINHFVELLITQYVYFDVGFLPLRIGRHKSGALSINLFMRLLGQSGPGVSVESLIELEKVPFRLKGYFFS